MSPDEVFVRGAFHEYSRLVGAAHGFACLAAYFAILCVISLLWTLTARHVGDEWASLIFAVPWLLAIWPAGAVGLKLRRIVQRRFCRRYPHVPPAPSSSWCNDSAPCFRCGVPVPIRPYIPERREVGSMLSQLGEHET